MLPCAWKFERLFLEEQERIRYEQSQKILFRSPLQKMLTPKSSFSKKRVTNLMAKGPSHTQSIVKPAQMAVENQIHIISKQVEQIEEASSRH